MRKAVSACCAALLLTAAAPALSLEDPEEIEAVIEHRQNVMRAIGGLTGASVGVIRDQLQYGDNLVIYATAIEALTRDIPALFPEGSDFGDTDALPEVWSQRERFEELAAENHQQTEAFLRAVENGDRAEIGARFREMGDSCKACHDDFRAQRD
jgi:cytochrome c556